MVEEPTTPEPVTPPGLLPVESLRTAEEFRAAVSVIASRLSFLNMAGIAFDGKRDYYSVFGYKRILTNKDYRDRYERGGVAGRIVDSMADATWRGEVQLREDKDAKADTPFELAWQDLDQKHQIQAKLRRVDKLSRLSEYAVLLIGAPGELETELPKVSNPDSLLYLSPFSGGGGPGGNSRSRTLATDADCTIETFDVDPKSPRFGFPLTYQLRRTDVSSPDLARPVHWTRILHVAEEVLDNEVYGEPALRRVWNLLDDLDKVTGGGAEAFWLRANAGLHLDVDKDMSIPAPKAGEPSEVDKLKAQLEDYSNQLVRAIRTRGVKIEQLGSDVANFSSPADAILTQIAGAKGMPKRILIGSEMGELASSQDRDNWKDQINGRQTGYAGPYIVRTLVNRLIDFGYLPNPSKGALAYEVVWPHIQTLTEDEKAAGALKWAQVNASAGFTVFTDAEIRDKWYGMGEQDEVATDAWRADLALKMANTNKTQGAVIFTDDEIRKTCYGWKPLTPEQKVPITAPERISATAPTPKVDLQGNPVLDEKGQPVMEPPKPPAKVLPFKAAELADTLKALEAAIEANDVQAIAKIVGLDA